MIFFNEDHLIKMKYEKFKLSIILPCYNEENNILNSFKVVLRSLKTSKIKNFEIIFVDDGSTDKSKQKIINIIKNFKNKFLIKKFLSKNLGLGELLELVFKSLLELTLFLFLQIIHIPQRLV